MTIKKLHKVVLSIALATILMFVFMPSNAYAAMNYESQWHNAGEAMYGSFNVAGPGGSTCNITVGINSFSPSTDVEIAIYQNGVLISSVSSWSGGFLSTGGTSQYVFYGVHGASGTYTIKYQIYDPDSSGRIMCWAYN